MEPSPGPAATPPPLPTAGSERPGVVYFRAVVWAMPALFFLSFALLFVLPKMKQISSSMLGHPVPALLAVLTGIAWPVIRHLGVWTTCVGALVALFEWVVPPRAKRRWRGVVVGFVPWCLNVLALAALTMLSVEAAILVPIIHAREEAYRKHLITIGELDRAQAPLRERLRYVPPREGNDESNGDDQRGSH